MATNAPHEVAVVDPDNKEVGRVALPEPFGARISDAVMFEQIMAQRATRRSGTHSTKTRGLVSGGGAKPWRQKGTGRARAGSSRSPIWRGGGTTFGPQPRSYEYRLPRSARRAAVRSALAMKAREGNVRVIDGLHFDTPKTKQMLATLGSLGIANETVFLITADRDRGLELSARNLPRVKVLAAAGINVEDVVRHEILLITKDALAAIEERLS